MGNRKFLQVLIIISCLLFCVLGLIYQGIETKNSESISTIFEKVND